MDLENQKRVKEFVEQYGAENIVVLLGAAEGEGAGLAAETVTNGDPTFAGPLAGVSLGLRVYHVCEPEVKAEFDEAVYDEQVVYEEPAPKGKLINGVGAGDSMVAGFMAGYMEKQDYEYAFHMGIAAGSASAFSENLATREEIEAVYQQITGKDQEERKK